MINKMILCTAKMFLISQKKKKKTLKTNQEATMQQIAF